MFQTDTCIIMLRTDLKPLDRHKTVRTNLNCLDGFKTVGRGGGQVRSHVRAYLQSLALYKASVAPTHVLVKVSS